MPLGKWGMPGMTFGKDFPSEIILACAVSRLPRVEEISDNTIPTCIKCYSKKVYVSETFCCNKQSLNFITLN